MTITREQVADLREGDVVELTHAQYPEVVIRGPLTDDGGMLRCGFAIVRHSGGEVSMEPLTLTVVSSTPRPLYVNHPRTEPAVGDVVRDADDLDGRHWMYVSGARPWCGPRRYFDADGVPSRLRLLVDGETGRCLP